MDAYNIWYALVVEHTEIPTDDWTKEMKKVYIVISNNGDGSNSLKFFKNTPYEVLDNLDESTGDYERWGSGDGVQITELVFPDDFDVTTIVPYYYWSDEDILEYLSDEDILE